MPLASPSLQVALIGARRRRQGTGPYLARFLVEAGARLVAVLGTAPASVAQAQADLAGLAPRIQGFTDVAAMLGATRPDLLVVASPSETHEAYLAAGLAAGCHVLCEKPLLAGGSEPGARAQALAHAFLARGRHLIVTAQWPFTLPAFATLHPGSLEAPPARFEMHLGPARPGPWMLEDALPHVLSLLAALRPGEARIARPCVDVLDAQGTRVEVRFAYEVLGEATEVQVRLDHQPHPPRRAGYAVDGRGVQRHIQMPGYRLFLEGGGRRLEIEDPLRRLVHDAVGRVVSGTPPRLDPLAWPAPAQVALLAACWPSGGPLG